MGEDTGPPITEELLAVDSFYGKKSLFFGVLPTVGCLCSSKWSLANCILVALIGFSELFKARAGDRELSGG